MRSHITGGFISPTTNSLGMTQRNANGTFKRIRTPFSLNNFDDGYVDNDGRFRVWSPDHPRAYLGGYILRSIVAYDLYHKTAVPLGMNIHHIDGNRLNDEKENLMLISHAEHSTKHGQSRKKDVTKICKFCKKEFKIKKWRLKQKTRGTFCSQKCYHSYSKGKNHSRYSRITTVCEQCGNLFEHIPSRKLRFCSTRCSNRNRWNKMEE